MSVENQIDEIKKILQNHVEFAVLIGSFGTLNLREDSDVDIVVYYRDHIDKHIKVQLWDQIEILTKRTVELIEVNKIDPIFAKQVIDTGRVLINNSPDILLNWKSLNFSKYVDLKINRKPVEDNLLVRKKI